MARATFKFTLRDSHPMSPSTRGFVLGLPDRQPLKFTPGQFVQIHFEIDGEEVTRSYSIASAPSSRDEVELAIAYVEGGKASRYLWGLKPGDPITVSGPYGRFVLRDESIERYVLVATGTGVAPYRTMLPELERRMATTGLKAHVVFGCREPSEVLYAEEFAAFAAAHPGFEYTVCYSRKMPEHPRPWEHRGYVQRMFATLDVHPDRDVVYLCGNPNMVDSAVTELTQRGYSPFKIRREKYISGGG